MKSQEKKIDTDCKRYQGKRVDSYIMRREEKVRRKKRYRL